ncbi:MAG: hypothetical protein ACRDLB_04440 [Actinomycetota bacterium]
MLLFRSEEHLERWLAERGLSRGEIFSPEQQWTMAKIWYANRMSRDWHRGSPGEAEAVFRNAGLVSDFWKLTS